MPRRRLSIAALGAGTVGNILEWYDFGIYGYLAPVIGSLFFPSHNPVASLLGAYGGFAIGFLMRPIGGAVLGHVGDRVGRRAVLIASVVMMGGATTAVGLLPTYGEVGVWAPILLLLVRLFQGFSVGGEFTGSVSYLVETAPPKRRGLAGSFANVGSTSGYLLAAGFAALTVSLASPADLHDWAWRIPFIVGGVLAVLAFIVRRRLKDTGFQPKPDAADKGELPIQRAFKYDAKALTLAVMFTWGYGVADYLTLVFLPTFASKFGHVANGAALTVTTSAMAVAVGTIPIAGWVSDHWLRRRTLLLTSFALILVTAVGFFQLAQDGGTADLWVVEILFGVMLGVIMGAAPAMLAELFRSEYRLSGYSLTFNIGLGIGGGTAPLLATALIAVTNYGLSAAAYLMFGSLLSIGSLYFMFDKSRESLC